MHSKNRFFIDPLKFFAGLTFFLFLTVISVCLLSMYEYSAAAIFFGIGLLFVPAVLRYGRLVTLDGNGAKITLLGRTGLTLGWDEVAEVGLAGSRLFGHKPHRKTEIPYLYLSPAVLTEKQRFDMMLRFPPRDKIVLTCTAEVYKAVRRYWSGPVQSYNTDKSFDIR